MGRIMTSVWTTVPNKAGRGTSGQIFTERADLTRLRSALLGDDAHYSQAIAILLASKPYNFKLFTPSRVSLSVIRRFMKPFCGPNPFSVKISRYQV